MHPRRFALPQVPGQSLRGTLANWEGIIRKTFRLYESRPCCNLSYIQGDFKNKALLHYWTNPWHLLGRHRRILSGLPSSSLQKVKDTDSIILLRTDWAKSDEFVNTSCTCLAKVSWPQKSRCVLQSRCSFSSWTPNL